MNFYFEMAINILEVTLILSFFSSIFRIPNKISCQIHMDYNHRTCIIL